jgi:erythromycin esterase-like protein
MNSLLDFKLIGVGEFSHGIQQSWEFRFKLLKLAMRNTRKKIFIFNEMSVWQAENVMNDTIFSRETNKVVPFFESKFKKEEPVKGNTTSSPWGVYWQYVHHSTESTIVMKIFKFVRKNKNRIQLIGVDPDNLDRDYFMYKKIMKHFDPKNINFFWAHNSHISDAPLATYNSRYLTTKNSKKFYCGHYLKNKLGNEYCIILSQAFSGQQRFNGSCIGKECETRTWSLKYTYNRFHLPSLQKYTNPRKTFQLFSEYNEPFIYFSNSFFRENELGASDILLLPKTWDYVLFWNQVTPLEPIEDYY